MMELWSRHILADTRREPLPRWEQPPGCIPAPNAAFWELLENASKNGVKKAISPNKVWLQRPFPSGLPCLALQRACRDLLWQRCWSAPLLPWDKPGPEA